MSGTSTKGVWWLTVSPPELRKRCAWQERRVSEALTHGRSLGQGVAELRPKGMAVWDVVHEHCELLWWRKDLPYLCEGTSAVVCAVFESGAVCVLQCEGEKGWREMSLGGGVELAERVAHVGYMSVGVWAVRSVLCQLEDQSCVLLWGDGRGRETTLLSVVYSVEGHELVWSNGMPARWLGASVMCGVRGVAWAVAVDASWRPVLYLLRVPLQATEDVEVGRVCEEGGDLSPLVGGVRAFFVRLGPTVLLVMLSDGRYRLLWGEDAVGPWERFEFGAEGFGAGECCGVFEVGGGTVSAGVSRGVHRRCASCVVSWSDGGLWLVSAVDVVESEGFVRWSIEAVGDREMGMRLSRALVVGQGVGWAREDGLQVVLSVPGPPNVLEVVNLP